MKKLIPILLLLAGACAWGQQVNPRQISAGTFPGALSGPSFNGSLNNQVNIMAPGLGAVDNTCTGDDTAAFTAAQNLAETFAVGNVRAATIVIPPGCYNISSAFKWQNVSIWGLSGPASSNAYGTGGVIIKQTTAGADVLAGQDPSLGTSTYSQSSWSLKHLTLVVNDGAQGTHPHRWPGRWCDDVATTNGSAVIKTTACKITPGDVGQAIMLTGAGAAGANLTTTIQSVTPAWAAAGSNWQVITLAAAASATLATVHTYIATGNLAATVNIGPCGIAFDDYDGKAANWPVGEKNISSSYSTIEDVSITGASIQSNGQNNSCGIFAQGASTMYALHVRQFNFNRLVYGVVQTTSEINQTNASSNGDYQTWKDGQFNNDYEPWLSVNGETATLDTIETNGTPIGFQILGTGNSTGDANDNWRVSNVSGGGAPFTTLGWNVTGRNHVYTDVQFGNNAFLSTLESTYVEANMFNATVGGNLNVADGRGQITGTVTNVGLGNSGFGVPGSNSLSVANSKMFAGIPYKGSNPLGGRVTADFISDGNGLLTAYNHDDLFIWPQDMMYNNGGNPTWGTYFTADSTAVSGATWNFVTGGQGGANFQQFTGPGQTGGLLEPGVNMPIKTTDITFSGKCDGGTTSFQFKMYVFGGTATTTYAGTCSTSFQTYTTTLALTNADSGHNMQFAGNTAGNFRVQWIDIQPQTNADTASQLTGSATITSSATPAFISTVNVNYMVLTANVTSWTIPNGTLDGQETTITLCQNGVGGFTVSGAPATARGFMSIPGGEAANKCNSQQLLWNAGQTAWLANGPGVVNE